MNGLCVLFVTAVSMVQSNGLEFTVCVCVCFRTWMMLIFFVFVLKFIVVSVDTICLQISFIGQSICVWPLTRIFTSFLPFWYKCHNLWCNFDIDWKEFFYISSPKSIIYEQSKNNTVPVIAHLIVVQMCTWGRQYLESKIPVES